MSEPNRTHIELSSRLLASDEQGAADPAATAARGYSRLLAHLSPLVGTAGVRALFVRSVRLAKGDHPCLAGLAAIQAEHSSKQEATVPENPADELREFLAQQHRLTMPAVTALFGHFCALLAAFIGERLTEQVIEEVWVATSKSGPTKRNS